MYHSSHAIDWLPAIPVTCGVGMPPASAASTAEGSGRTNLAYNATAPAITVPRASVPLATGVSCALVRFHTRREASATPGPATAAPSSTVPSRGRRSLL
jgi:hypothetical protein